MKKIYILIVASIILFIPLLVNAKSLQKVSYEDAKIYFEIDSDEWTKTELNDERDYIDKKWNSNCGQITSGIYDIYSELSEEDTGGLSRSEYSYRNLITSEEDAKTVAESLINGLKEKNNLESSHWYYEEFEVNFIKVTGTTTVNEVSLYFENYYTINNGYLILIQKMVGPDDELSCTQSVEDIVKSARVTDFDSREFNPLTLLLDLIITVVAYISYPFIRIKIMKHNYTENEAKKMVLLNSVIVGCIFLILNIIVSEVNGSSLAWSAGPAFFYYCINSAIWVPMFKGNDNKRNNKKTKEKNINEKDIEQEKIYKCSKCGATTDYDFDICPNCNYNFLSSEYENDNIEDNIFVCDNCGAKVSANVNKCPNCGETFDGENEVEYEMKKENSRKLSDTDMDKKYSDLNKLKKLLDKEIITKEEFEQEKKKILDNN